MPEFYEFQTHPLGKELRKRVSKIIYRMAIFRFTNYALFSGQLAILDDLLALEASLRLSRDEASSLRKKANQLAQLSLSNEKVLSDHTKLQIQELQQEAKEHDFAVRLLRYGRWLYRYVADGIAWRAYGFDRRAIRALGAKEPVVFLSKKDGIEKEIMLFKGMRQLGRQWLPIMHDLTNCLRTGDFSLFNDRILFRIVELKIRQSKESNKAKNQTLNSAREVRQAKRLQQVSDFMQSGDLESLDPDLKGGKALSTTIIEKHNFDAISKAVNTARVRKIGFCEPERGILYIAFEGNTHPVDEAILQASRKHPHIFNTLFTFRAITPRFEEYHVSLPITAMNLPARNILDIIFGRIAVICMLNYQCVEEFCREKGVPLRFQNTEQDGFRIIVESKPYTGEVLDGLWNRVLLEGLSLSSFTEFVKAIMNEYALDNTDY